MNKFNWEDFYSINNAKIIEDLLDGQSVSIDQLSLLLFPRIVSFRCDPSDFKPHKNTTRQKIINNFKQTIEDWKNTTQQLDPFREILVNYDDKDRKITGATLLKSKTALSLLVNKGLLPAELYRLPRATKDIKIKINNDYYIEQKELFYTPKDIIKSPVNYVKNTPRILTYSELVIRWREKNIYEDDIWQNCFLNKLGAYLKVSAEENIKYSWCPNTFGSWAIKRKMNCGNPFYLQRYYGLERLVLDEENSDISLKKLHQSGSLPLLSKNSYYHNFLQNTDIETKFHLARTLKSFKGKNKIEMEDLVFLVEEVENIEKTIPLLNSSGNTSSIDKLPLEITKSETEANDSSLGFLALMVGAPIFFELLKNFAISAGSELIKSNLPSSSSDNILKDIKNFPETSDEKPIFTKKNQDVWSIKYGGSEHNYKYYDGFIYIDYLLSNPHKSISSSKLRSLKNMNGHDQFNIDSNTEEDATSYENIDSSATEDATLSNILSESRHEILDKNAIAQCRKRQKQLKEEIGNAKKEERWDEAEELEEEEEKISKELKKIINIKGQSRAFPDKAKKDAKAIKKAINTALGKIEKEQPELYSYLKKTIQTGLDCTYNPLK